jgi:hypothetical protein
MLSFEDSVGEVSCPAFVAQACATDSLHPVHAGLGSES